MGSGASIAFYYDRERSRVVEKLQTQINHETFHLDLCWFWKIFSFIKCSKVENKEYIKCEN